jgi:hypothetical protein
MVQKLRRMNMEDTQQATEAQLKARKREGIRDRVIRAKAKSVGWKSGSLDDFMFELGWLRRGKGEDARWFKIER